MAGRDRCMGREYGSGANFFKGLFKAQAGADFFPYPLQHSKGRMALVKMKYRMFYPQGGEDLGPSDAKNDFLPQPLLISADIKMRRDISVPRVIRIDVGVHEIQGDLSNLDLPYLYVNGRLNKRDLHCQTVAT